jgi:hypothetical protein
MRNAKSGWVVAGCGALMAAWLAACVDSGKEPEQLRGLARNTCGPTDGPAVEVVIRKNGTGGCADTGAVEARLFLEWQQVDSLRSGKAFSDTGMVYVPGVVCVDGSCRATAIYRLQIESADGSSAHGTLETREQGTNGSETVKRFDVDLTKCPAIIQMCG